MNHETPPRESVNSQRIDAILDQALFFRLTHHLANGSLGKGAFISRDGPPVIRDLRNGSLREKIQSTWNSITSYDPFDPKPFSLVVYDRHPVEHTSTWAAVDVDWHQDEGLPPDRWAVVKRLCKAAARFQQEGACDALILELSGRGAHLWLVARSAQSLGKWKSLLNKLLSDAECLSVRGVDLFPASASRSSRGHALRLPGSVNVMRFTPRDGCPISTIVDHKGLLELIPQLPDPASIKKSVYIGSDKGTELPSKAAKAKAEEQEANWLVAHAIDAPRTRHNRSRALIVATAFFRPTEQVLQLCEKLHRSAHRPPATPLEEHLNDCQRMLDDWLKKVSQTVFTPEEQHRMIALEHLRHRTAFHAIHNFHRLALIKRKRDFAISSEALGRAIGASYKTALEDLKHFIEAGILERTVPAVRCRSCAHYRWLLPHLSEEEVRRRWKQLGWEVPVPI
jgi:hypothetical protein